MASVMRGRLQLAGLASQEQREWEQWTIHHRMRSDGKAHKPHHRGVRCGLTLSDCWRRAIGRWSAGTCAPMRAAIFTTHQRPLLMHGNEADPVFCYANRTAQRLWGLTWDEFIRLPSRLSAEPLVPGRARPAAGARARPWLHRRLPGRADREGRHALPHLGRRGVDGGGRRRGVRAGGAVPRVGARLRDC